MELDLCLREIELEKLRLKNEEEFALRECEIKIGFEDLFQMKAVLKHSDFQTLAQFKDIVKKEQEHQIHAYAEHECLDFAGRERLDFAEHEGQGFAGHERIGFARRGQLDFTGHERLGFARRGQLGFAEHGHLDSAELEDNRRDSSQTSQRPSQITRLSHPK
jgi:hypothetical protein